MCRVVTLVVVVALGACGSERGPVATRTVPPSPVPPSPTVTATASPSPTAAPRPIDVGAVMRHVRALAVDIGSRNAGSDGDEKASLYIAGQIERLGWKVERRAFELPQGGRSWNVVGTPPAFDEAKPYVIVGGHYDSLNGPGANDNATGIGAALEIARYFDDHPARVPVRFIAFGAEERQPHPERPHHIGSVDYVADMSEDAKENLVVMMNIDMVGRGDEIICGRIATGPRDGTNRCVSLGKQLGFAVRERVTPNWSDHGSFAERGMNTAWVWTGDDPCCYHNPQDTIARVREDDVRRSAELALAIVQSYTG